MEFESTKKIKSLMITSFTTTNILNMKITIYATKFFRLVIKKSLIVMLVKGRRNLMKKLKLFKIKAKHSFLGLVAKYRSRKVKVE